MPIRINLLAESLAAEDLRRRDPAKRAILIGMFLVALSLVWFSSTWLEYKLVQSKFSQVQDEIHSRTNDYNRVLIDIKNLAGNQRRLDALQQLSTNRFLQGNLMNALQHIYVPNVQLIRVRINQNYIHKEGTQPKTNGNSAVGGSPGKSIEQITLTLDAKDSSPNPGDQVNRFKDTVMSLDYFKSALNETNGVRLLNLSAPQVGLNGKPFVQFTLECRFPDKTR
jgi:hypothetical protein